MDNKTKELIAIAASVSANCIPCLDFHLDKARNHGAIEKELIIATKIGLQVKAGAAKKMEEYIPTLLTRFQDEEVKDICQCD